MPPRGPQGKPTQERILEAARREFGLKGFAGARVESIAKQAGVNKGLIFYYFESKEGLFRALAHDRFAHQPVPEGHEPDEALQWPLWLFGLGNETQDWVRFFMWEGLEVDGGMPRLLMEAARKRGWDRRVAWVAEQQRAGELPKDLDTRQLTLFLYMLGVYPYMVPQLAYLITGSLPGDSEFAEQFTAFVRELTARLHLTKRSK